MNSFLYLDEYKMYSISAQIFGGLTESIVEFSGRGKSDSEEQKGPIGSGRLLADIVSEQTGRQERRFLHDYAFTLFEQKLREDGVLLDLVEPLPDSYRQDLARTSFVKVTGRALFTDVPLLVDLMKKFNDIGESLTYISTFGKLSELKATLDGELEGVKDRNRKAALQQQVKSITNIKRLAKEQGLQQDPKFLEHLASLITYMMKDDFEVQVSLPAAGGAEVCFNSPLHRESLRESCGAIIRKYSRQCEEPLTLLGIVTQGKSPRMQKEQAIEGGEGEQKGTTDEPGNFRKALLHLVNATSSIEESFFGRLPNEYVIDPIAVFRQL